MPHNNNKQLSDGQSFYIRIVSYTLHLFLFKASFQYCPLSLQLDLQAHLQSVLQLDLHLDLHVDLQVIQQSNQQARDRGLGQLQYFIQW